MGVAVAEYFGQRTDLDEPVIQPKTEEDYCPFSSGNICKKLKSHNPPVCSVRRSDGTMWIVCSDRLCNTKKDIPLCDHQKHILYKIAQNLFSHEVTAEDVCVKREERLNVVEGTKYNADYIISLSSGRSDYSGPDRLVLEMQGGGETSNTGKITSLIARWANDFNRTNEMLRSDTDASTLETNAWRRQQEQFIVKGNIAMKTWKGYGIAFCVGTILYDYLMNKLASANLPNLRDYNWTLAIIAIKEDNSVPPRPGPIPITVDESRMLFTNYQTFVQALINQGEPSLDAFRGEFINLNNETVIIP
ncbi:MAG: restriction endonuclease [Lachnospiraceae bacterium]|nr:restriction endonuclease [Lachnospiraceae bacterium]